MKRLTLAVALALVATQAAAVNISADWFLALFGWN